MLEAGAGTRTLDLEPGHKAILLYSTQVVNDTKGPRLILLVDFRWVEGEVARSAHWAGGLVGGR